MADIQPSLFSARQTRRVWLERLVIPRFRRADGTLARTNPLKHFLRVIESHAGTGGPCCLLIATISHEMGVDERTVYRHIDDAKQLGLLTVKAASGRASYYEIDWTAVAQAILDCPMTTHLIDQSDHYRTPDKLSKTPDNLVTTPDNLAQTPDNLSRKMTDLTSYPRTRSEPCINHELTMFKPSSVVEQEIGGWKPPLRGSKNDVLEMEGTRKPKPGFSGWPCKITRDHLRDWMIVQSLWLHALERRYVQHHHRTNFFVLCLWIAENPVYANPGGKLTVQLRDSVASGQWPGTNQQEITAQAAIANIDRPQRVTMSDLSESNDFEAKRKAAIAELLRKHG